MGYSIEVDSGTFNTDVIEMSYQKPVLIDFFATWCGPCQVLKPLLEKLVKEYDFILAKIDIDQNQDLASHYGVEGVPDVRIVVQGEMMPGFVGVLPEVQLRQLLRQLNLKSALETGLDAIHQAMAAGNHQQAKQLFDQLFAQYPNHRQLTLEAAKFLITLNQLEDANKLLNTIQEDDREYFPQAQAVKALVEFKQALENPGDSELDQMFAAGCRFTLTANYEAALQQFLKILERSRKYRDDGARKAMLAIFQLLGDDHSLTKEYRKQLLLQLY